MTIFSENNGQARLLPVVLLVALLFGANSLGSQETSGLADAGAGQEAASTTATAAAETDENAIFLDGTGASADIARKSGGTSIWILLRVILVLAIVCAGIYGVVYFLKKTTRMNVASDPYLKSVASLALAPGKTVQIVSIGSRAFLVGCTDAHINLLAELDDRELIDAMNLAADKNSAIPPGNFASVLSSFFPAKAPRGADSEPPAASERGSESLSGIATADFLRQQRERLRSGSGAGREE